jgi:ribosomal protein L37AE/L43A
VNKCPKCKVIGGLIKIGPGRYQCRACGRIVKGK